MTTPLWLTALVAVLAPAAVLWSVHRTDRREQEARDAAVTAEYRQARRDAYVAYLNSLSFLQIMSVERAAAMPDWYKTRSDEMLIAENSMRIYATPFLREVAALTTSTVVRTLMTLDAGNVRDATREDHFDTFRYLHECVAIAIRGELEVAARLDGEQAYVRSWRTGFIKRANVTTQTSQDLTTLHANFRTRAHDATNSSTT